MSVSTLTKSVVEMIEPLDDRIVIQREPEEEKSKGGILIPDTASKEKPVTGAVVAVGPGKRLESGQLQPLSVKVGDKVVFGKYAGTEVKLDDKDYIIMRESDVMAKMKD